jgi:hypothetical protein
MRNRVVLIDWEDSNVTHGWIPIEEQDELARCQTVGFVVREDTQKITVTLGNSNYNNTMERLTIPKPCIKSIRELRVR